MKRILQEPLLHFLLLGGLLFAGHGAPGATGEADITPRATASASAIE